MGLAKPTSDGILKALAIFVGAIGGAAVAVVAGKLLDYLLR